MGMVELEVMLCVTGNFNVPVRVAELGEEDCVGKFGWRTRNREGLELVERIGLAIAGLFFQKWDSHKIICKGWTAKKRNCICWYL